MKNLVSDKIEITRVENSKLDKTTLNGRKFGATFTDHMFTCTFREGRWQNPEILPYKPLAFEPSARVFHYGQAVFEGMKAYKDKNDEIWLFRPEENQKRINASAKRLMMPELPKELFFEGLETLLRLDKDWIPTAEGNSLYVRPFMIATGNGIFAAPSAEYTFMIICSPSGKYYSKDVKVVVAEYYSRAANGGVGAAKAAGNYGAQFYPTQKAIEQGYDQIIWTDSTHQFLEEAGTMNIFFRINDTLITAPTSERILDGVTRKSIIDIAKDQGIEVQERKVGIDEIKEAANNRSLKEMFGAGTAAVITPISHFSHKGKDYEIEKMDNRYSDRFKKQLTDIQYNLSEDKFGWRYKVDS